MKLINIPLSDHAVLTGYLHEPSEETPNITSYPAMLVVPGGGFRFCSFRESEPIALAYFAEGFQAFTLKYTTITDVPGTKIEVPMQENQAAIKTIRAHEKDWFVTPGKLAQIGFSGGAHLSAANAVHGPERPDLLLLGYPGILHSDLRAMECPDIVESVDSNTPESFIFVTHDDPITPPKHALAFAGALEKAGVPYELHIFRHGVHGLSLAKPLTSGGYKDMVNPAVARWFPMSLTWLRDIFGEFSADRALDFPMGLEKTKEEGV